jgi:hypothetical protein
MDPGSCKHVLILTHWAPLLVRYSKDDLWVVSLSSRFDAANTFFARSVFYGPSGNDVEVSSLRLCRRRTFNLNSDLCLTSPVLVLIIDYLFVTQ